MVPNISFDNIKSIFSIGVTITPILIAVLTLRQNSKMIEESTRPAVCVYSEYLIVGETALA